MRRGGRGLSSVYCSVRSSTWPLRQYPLLHAGSSAMHFSASSIAAEKAPRWVWQAARLLYAAVQGRAGHAMQHRDGWTSECYHNVM